MSLRRDCHFCFICYTKEMSKCPGKLLEVFGKHFDVFGKTFRSLWKNISMFSGKHLEVFYSLFEEFFLCLHVLLNELGIVKAAIAKFAHVTDLTLRLE